MGIELPKPREVALSRTMKDYKSIPSLDTVLPDELAVYVSQMPDKYIDLTEEEAKVKLGEMSPTIAKLRILFWREYDRAHELRYKMDINRICMGVCTRSAFLRLMRTVTNFAWMLTPPMDYLLEVEELSRAALHQMRALLESPLNSGTGEVNVRLGELKLKILMALDMRLHGAYLQRSMQVTQNVNRTEVSYTNNTNMGGNVEFPEQPELTIDEQIFKLESDIRDMQNKVKGELSESEYSRQLKAIEEEIYNKDDTLSTTYVKLKEEKD